MAVVRSERPAVSQAELPPHRARARVTFGMAELMIAVLALGGFMIVLGSRADFDFWWHLAAGRFIALHHALPVPDEFSFTAAGRRWIAHEWLAELGIYAAERAFGVTGPFVLLGVCMAGTVLLTISTMRRVGARIMPVALWTLVMLLALQPYAGPRPQVGAFLLMAAVVWLLERWIARRDHSVWLLPPLFCLWGNLHGSFAVGLAVPGLLLAGDVAAALIGWDRATRLRAQERRELALVLAASVAALAVNPNGPRILLYPFTKLDNPLLRFLTEWRGTDISDPRWWGFAALAGGYAALVAVRRPKLSAADLLTAGAFMFAALWCARFVPFAVLVLMVLIARVYALPSAAGITAPPPWAAMRARLDGRAARSAHPTIFRQGMNVLVLMLAAVVLVATVVRYDAATDERLPVQAVNALGAEGLKGPLFHDYNWGGYLIWRLFPRVKVFIDGRGDDLYTEGGELRKYIDVVLLSARADAVLNEYRIRTVLFPKDTPLVRYLLAGGRWRTTYDDGRVVRLERAR